MNENTAKSMTHDKADKREKNGREQKEEKTTTYEILNGH